MPRDERHNATIPYGTLGIVPLKSCSKMGEKVDDYKYIGIWVLSPTNVCGVLCITAYILIRL